MPVPKVTRREAVRQATRQEIVDAARRLLAGGGPPNVSLRAVAGEVGMTAPGIYRYFPSHDDLLIELTDLVAGELVDALEAAAASQPADDPALQLLAASRAFRAWCIGHPREFQLAFGLAPAPPGGDPLPHCDVDNVRRLCSFFFSLFVAIWRQQQFPVDSAEHIDPALVTQMQRFLDIAEYDVPVGLVKVYADGWVRLYGMVALELYGHLRFVLTDAEAFFETMLAEYAAATFGRRT